MARPRQTHCLRGHAYTAANSIVSIRANGKVNRHCKTCNAYRYRLKYRHDEAYREYQKRKARERYALLKELNHGGT